VERVGFPVAAKRTLEDATCGSAASRIDEEKKERDMYSINDKEENQEDRSMSTSNSISISISISIISSSRMNDVEGVGVIRFSSSSTVTPAAAASVKWRLLENDTHDDAVSAAAAAVANGEETYRSQYNKYDQQWGREYQ